jgi:hypothetical protein
VSIVLVAILHPELATETGPLEQAVTAARDTLAQRHAAGFRAAGAGEVRILRGPPDGVPFGRRVRALLDDIAPGDGLVLLGSGAVPLLTAADRRRIVGYAAGGRPRALTNNAYSADLIAVADATTALRDLPDLETDNILPRWLAEVGRVPVVDLRARWRLGVDIDGPLDLVLLGGRWRSMLDGADSEAVRATIARVLAVIEDPRAELLVAGRVSAANLAWLEARTASRTRALIEERGLRARRAGQRPAASVLGALLGRDGPGSLGALLTRLGDAAILDTRVLLAHRFGAGEDGWPAAEDRFASDLLLPARIADPWLRELTAAATEAPIPVLLGGHTLVGPGLRLALGTSSLQRRAPPARGLRPRRRAGIGS